MADMYCRLCLSRENVLDVFSKELINSDQLRKYIWLCSGVNILATDKVSKYICNSCCQISIKIFQFRKNAIAHDVALKNLLHQSRNPISEDPLHSTVLTVNDFLVKKPNIQIKLDRDDAATSTQPPKENKQYVIHPSIFKLMRLHPKTILPSNLISTNCDPRVHIPYMNITESDLQQIPLQDDTINAVDQSGGENLVLNNKVTEMELPQIPNPVENNPCVRETIRTSGIWFPNVDEVIPQASGSVKRILIEEPYSTKKIKVITDIPPSTPDLINNESDVSDVRSSAHIPPELNDESDLISNVMADDEESANTILQVPQEQQSRSQSPLSVINIISSARNDDELSLVTDDDNYSDGDYVPDPSDYSLLETFEVKPTFACHTCNKMFDKKRNLKCHRQRMHKTCIVCKKVFRSQSNLVFHMRSRCFKTIIRNQPILRLKKCDNMVEKLNTTVESNFEVFYISDDDEQRITNLDPQLITAAEHKHILALYQKHHTAVPSFYKSTRCQEDIELYTVKMGKGQATLSNMYSLLKYYRICVNLTSGDSMKVEITNVPEESSSTPKISDWAGYRINRTSCEIISTTTLAGRQIVPKPPLPIQNIQNAKKNSPLKDALASPAQSITTNTSSIIVNTLNTLQQLQRPATLGDNHLQLQIKQNVSVLHTANNQTIDISSSQHRQLVAPIGTHTGIPQTLTTNVNPSNVQVQQIPLIFPPQTFIRTVEGYIIPANSSFTVPSVQSVPSNRNSNALPTITHTMPNQTITIATPNQSILRPVKRNELPRNFTITPIRSALPNNPVKSPVQRTIIPKVAPDPKLTSPINNTNLKPVSLGNSSCKNVESAPTMSDGKSSQNYLRVKAPWELK